VALVSAAQVANGVWRRARMGAERWQGRAASNGEPIGAVAVSGHGLSTYHIGPMPIGDDDAMQTGGEERQLRASMAGEARAGLAGARCCVLTSLLG
jgi:hypothetical protein